MTGSGAGRFHGPPVLSRMPPGTLGGFWMSTTQYGFFLGTNNHAGTTP